MFMNAVKKYILKLHSTDTIPIFPKQVLYILMLKPVCLTCRKIANSSARWNKDR